MTLYSHAVTHKRQLYSLCVKTCLRQIQKQVNSKVRLISSSANHHNALLLVLVDVKLAYFHTYISISDNNLCPGNWENIGTSCYLFVKHHVSWDESFAGCKKNGAQLVIPTNNSENNEIASMAKSKGLYFPWIGVFSYPTLNSTIFLASLFS